MTEMSGAFSAKKSRTDSRLIRCNYSRQFRQRMYAMVHLDAKLIHLRAQRLEQGERSDRLTLDAEKCHRLGRDTLDPGDVEAEGLCAAGIPGIGGDEKHFARAGAELLFDQSVSLRVRLEDLLRIDADCCIEHAVEACVPHQSVQHVRAAVGEDRKLLALQGGERIERIEIEIEVEIFADDALEG